MATSVLPSGPTVTLVKNGVARLHSRGAELLFCESSTTSGCVLYLFLQLQYLVFNYDSCRILPLELNCLLPLKYINM